MTLYGIPQPAPAWFWVAYLALGLLLIAAAWLGAQRRRVRVRTLSKPETGDREPVLCCITCGYDASAHGGDTCPECGTDLHDMGVLSPEQRRRLAVPPRLRVLAWTLVVALVAIPMTWLATAVYLPQERIVQVQLELQGPVAKLTEAQWKAIEEGERRLGAAQDRSTWPGGSDPAEVVLARASLLLWYPERYFPTPDEMPPALEEALTRTGQWTQVRIDLIREDAKAYNYTSPYWWAKRSHIAWDRGPGDASVIPTSPAPGAVSKPLPLDVAIQAEVRRLGLPEDTLLDDQLLAFLNPAAPPLAPQPIGARESGHVLDLMQPLQMTAARSRQGKVLPLWLLAATAYWGVVWLLGIPGVLRRRNVRGTPIGANIAFTAR